MLRVALPAVGTALTPPPDLRKGEAWRGPAPGGYQGPGYRVLSKAGPLPGETIPLQEKKLDTEEPLCTHPADAGDLGGRPGWAGKGRPLCSSPGWAAARLRNRPVSPTGEGTVLPVLKKLLQSCFRGSSYMWLIAHHKCPVRPQPCTLRRLPPSGVQGGPHKQTRGLPFVTHLRRAECKREG